MTLFDRDGKGIKPAAFAPRPASRRPRTSWLAPPMPKGDSVRPPPSAPIPNFGIDDMSHDELQYGHSSLAHDLSPRAPYNAPRFDDADASGTFLSQDAYEESTRGPGQAAGVIGNDGRVLAMLAELGDSLADLSRVHEAILSQAESQIIDLAVAIAKRVVAQEIHLDRGSIASLAREGILVLGSQPGAVVRIGEGFSPVELAEIQRRVADLKCEIVVDISLPPGRCIVEVDHGRVEESVDERLRAVIDSLEQTRGGKS